MQLHEQYRPTEWSQVVGQDKAIAKIHQIAKRGIGGRAYWLTGASGTGKTTIARLIASELADDWATEEIDSADATPARLATIEREAQCRAIGKGGRAYIVNEAHGLRRDAIRQLLVFLERLPAHVAVIFTTTSEAMESFSDGEDSAPLLSRCVRIELARRGLAEQFAARALEIARAENLDGQPIERYIRLAKDCRNNFRAMLQRIESGELIAE